MTGLAWLLVSVVCLSLAPGVALGYLLSRREHFEQGWAVGHAAGWRAHRESLVCEGCRRKANLPVHPGSLQFRRKGPV